MSNLPSLRRQIDRVDRRLLRLLNRRAALAVRVGRLKARRALPVFDGRREQQVLRRALAANAGPLSAASVRAVFRVILQQSRELERRRGA